MILSNSEFQHFFGKILNNLHGTESKMAVCFLRDVSTLSEMVSAVRETNFERYVKAERKMMKYCFKFGHINYLRYLTISTRILKPSKENRARL